MWQRIESAPKDGTMILAYNEAHKEMAVVGYTIEFDEWTDVGAGNQAVTCEFNANYFQFWMPLPAPPIATR